MHVCTKSFFKKTQQIPFVANKANSDSEINKICIGMYKGRHNLPPQMKNDPTCSVGLQQLSQTVQLESMYIHVLFN